MKEKNVADKPGKKEGKVPKTKVKRPRGGVEKVLREFKRPIPQKVVEPVDSEDSLYERESTPESEDVSLHSRDDDVGTSKGKRRRKYLGVTEEETKLKKARKTPVVKAEVSGSKEKKAGEEKEVKAPKGRKRKKNNVNCRIEMFYKVVHLFSEQKRRLVEQMGFGHLLGLKFRSLDRGFGMWLHSHFDTETHMLKFGDEEHQQLAVRANHVSYILGLNTEGLCVPKHIGELSCEAQETAESLKVQYKYKGGFDLGIILSEITKSTVSDQEFRTCFLIFLLGTILCPTQSSKVSSDLLAAFTLSERCKDYAWGEFVHSWLMEYAEKFQRNPRSLDGEHQGAGGCALVFMILYFDRKPLPRQVMFYRKPRIAAWSQEALEEAISNDRFEKGKYGKSPFLKDIFYGGIHPSEGNDLPWTLDKDGRLQPLAVAMWSVFPPATSSGNSIYSSSSKGVSDTYRSASMPKAPRVSICDAGNATIVQKAPKVRDPAPVVPKAPKVMEPAPVIREHAPVLRETEANYFSDDNVSQKVGDVCADIVKDHDPNHNESSPSRSKDVAKTESDTSVSKHESSNLYENASSPVTKGDVGVLENTGSPLNKADVDVGVLEKAASPVTKADVDVGVFENVVSPGSKADVDVGNSCIAETEGAFFGIQDTVDEQQVDVLIQDTVDKGGLVTGSNDNKSAVGEADCDGCSNDTHSAVGEADVDSCSNDNNDADGGEADGDGCKDGESPRSRARRKLKYKGDDNEGLVTKWHMTTDEKMVYEYIRSKCSRSAVTRRQKASDEDVDAIKVDQVRLSVEELSNAIFRRGYVSSSVVRAFRILLNKEWSTSTSVRYMLSPDFMGFATYKDREGIEQYDLKKTSFLEELRIVAEELKAIDYDQCSVIFVPCCFRNHWFCYAFSARDHRIGVLDSLYHMEGGFHYDVQAIVTQAFVSLMDILRPDCWTKIDRWEYNDEKVPTQEDCYTCGQHMLVAVSLWNGRWTSGYPQVREYMNNVTEYLVSKILLYQSNEAKTSLLEIAHKEGFKDKVAKRNRVRKEGVNSGC